MHTTQRQGLCYGLHLHEVPCRSRTYLGHCLGVLAISDDSLTLLIIETGVAQVEYGSHYCKETLPNKTNNRQVTLDADAGKPFLQKIKVNGTMAETRKLHARPAPGWRSRKHPELSSQLGSHRCHQLTAGHCTDPKNWRLTCHLKKRKHINNNNKTVDSLMVHAHGALDDQHSILFTLRWILGMQRYPGCSYFVQCILFTSVYD